MTTEIHYGNHLTTVSHGLYDTLIIEMISESKILKLY